MTWLLNAVRASAWAARGALRVARSHSPLGDSAPVRPAAAYAPRAAGAHAGGHPWKPARPAHGVFEGVKLRSDFALGRCGRVAPGKPARSAATTESAAPGRAHLGQVRCSPTSTVAPSGRAAQVHPGAKRAPPPWPKPPARPSCASASTAWFTAVVQAIVVHAQCDGTPAAAMLRRLITVSTAVTVCYSSIPVQAPARARGLVHRRGLRRCRRAWA